MRFARSVGALAAVVCLLASAAPVPARAADNQPPVAVDDPAIPGCNPPGMWGGAMPIPEDWIGPDHGYPGWFAMLAGCSPLANDTDPDGDPLTFEIVTPPSHGEALAIPDPSPGGEWLYYKPDADFSTVAGDQPGGQWVSDSIQYRAFDGQAYSNVATYSFWIAPINDAPSFTPGASLVTSWLGAGAVSVPWATDIKPGPPNESDQAVDFQMVSVNTTGAPNMFAVPPSIDANGNLSFTPGSEPGLATITVDLHDNGGLEDYGLSHSLIVPPANTSPTVQFHIAIYATQPGAPLAQNDTSGVDADTPVCVMVLGNDSSPLGRPLSVTAVTTPTKGTAAISTPDCGVLYTPDHGASGPDGFSYTVGDDQGRTASADVSLTLALPDPPKATHDDAAVAYETATCIDVLANDTLPTTGIAISDHTDGLHGTVAVHDGNASCPVEYTPATGYSGDDQFSYTLLDGWGQTSTGFVAVTVGDAPPPGNSAPVAKADTVSFSENPVAAPIDVLANDTDPDGDTLTITGATTPAHGFAFISGGLVNYAPTPGYIGLDSFDYTISDGHGHLATGTVSITVTQDTTPPVVGPLTISLPVQTIGISTVQARLAWTATDAVAGVASTALEVSANGGAFSPTKLTSARSTTAVLNLTPGVAYRFRTRATDGRGNASGWQVLGPVTIKRTQESNGSIAWSGAWARVSDSRLSAAASRRATTRGAKATFTFSGRTIMWVATRGARGGRAQVRIDGVYVGTIDTYAGSTSFRRTVFAKTLAKGGTHRIEIRALGDGFVDVDAFVVLP